MLLLLVLLLVFAFLFLIPKRKEKKLIKKITVQNKTPIFYGKHLPFFQRVKKIRYLCLLLGLGVVLITLYTLLVKRNLSLALIFDALLFLFLFIMLVTHIIELKAIKKYDIKKDPTLNSSAPLEKMKIIGLYGSSIFSILLSLLSILLSQK